MNATLGQPSANGHGALPDGLPETGALFGDDAPPGDVPASEPELEDPFSDLTYAHALDLLLSLSRRYPDYLPAAESVRIFADYLTKTADRIDALPPAVWEKGLRAFALRRVKLLCDACTRCPLHANRLGGRGSVFGEGPVDADLLLVGEGAGEHEQRTGLPFVGSTELRVSTCATQCDHFEACFVQPGNGQWASFPARSCDFTPVEVPAGRLAERLQKRGSGLHTAGEHLDRTLRKSGLVRTSFVQNLRMQQGAGIVPAELQFTPANVYLTNAVRCRAMDAQGQNTPPNVSQSEACRPWLEITRALVRPKRVAALGGIGLRSLVEKTPAEWKAFRITQAVPDDPSRPLHEETDRDGNAVGLLLHPAYVMRQDEQRPGHRHWEKMIADLNRLADRLDAA